MTDHAVAGVHHTAVIPFAYNTPVLATAAALYTPEAGDFLVDAWLEVLTPWNGTTPQCALGTLIDGTWRAIPGSDTNAAGIFPTTPYRLYADGLAGQTVAGTIFRSFIQPMRFTTTDAVRALVTTTGDLDGNDPAATQGSALLYLTTLTSLMA